MQPLAVQYLVSGGTVTEELDQAQMGKTDIAYPGDKGAAPGGASIRRWGLDVPDAKLKQLQDSKAALDQYDRSAKANLADQFQRMRDKILAEIQTAVNTKAKAAGYLLVLDSAAGTV